MNRAVRDLWVDFNRDLEGVVYHMYLDVKNLVTTGMGNLVDPVSLALPLPWRHPDGSTALQSEIAAEWSKVKRATAYAPLGGNAKAFRDLTRIRLDPSAVEALCRFKLLSNHSELRKRFKDLDEWPAPAQMAVHSMAWAMGPNFHKKFPTFCKHADARNWRGCAAECEMGP